MSEALRTGDPLTTLPSVPASDLGFETASWGRRILALFVDWVASTLVVIAVIGLDDYTETGNASGFIVLGVFVLESALFTALVGGSFGQVATRLRVLSVDGRRQRRPLLQGAGPAGADRAGHPAPGLPLRRARAARPDGRVGR